MFDFTSVTNKNTIATVVLSTAAILVYTIRKKQASTSSSVVGKNKSNGNDSNLGTDDDRDRLKSELRCLLSKVGGTVKQEEVVEIIEQLAAMNPIPTNCAQNDLFVGEFLSLGEPTYPGRIQNDKNIPQYKLGRLSFNIFQPQNLICTLRSTVNNVKPLEGENKFTYDNVSDLVIHLPAADGENKESRDLEATMSISGYCYPSDDVDNRIMVTFTGGSLSPKTNGKEFDKNEAAMLESIWTKEFANAYKKADEERSYLGWLMQYGVQWFLGLEYPTDGQQTFRYKMNKKMTFWLDTMYLDEDMRITKGSRGTIVVVDRIKKEMKDFKVAA